MPTDLPSNIENPRRIRSFVKRAGRMTPSQEHALENYWGFYGLELSFAIYCLSKWERKNSRDWFWYG